MVNRLAAETSPYLLQHVDNPVDWFPWGEEAFAEARRRDVPSSERSGFLSVRQPRRGRWRHSASCQGQVRTKRLT